MAANPPERPARTRAGLRLTTILIVVVILLGGAAAVVIARYIGTPGAAQSFTPSTTATPEVAAPSGALDEQTLAARQMLVLPAQAAQPQALTTASAGAAIVVPQPTITAGRWILGGFPDTPEGAIGQLVAVNTTALAAADPQVYAQGYRELSEPGAPDPGSTGLSALLRSMRARAQLPDTGPVSGLSASFQVTHGLVKGVTTGGRFAVVCVLGQFSIGTKGQVTAAGVGDCQAMRWNGTEWRIAAGTLAAAAPCAWPGSADAVKAGYRELR